MLYLHKKQDMSYLESITSDRQFKSTTGFDKAAFKALLEDFAEAYKEEKGKSYEDYILENLTVEETPKLKTLEDVLFFVLYQKKNDLIWDCFGFTFKMSGARAHELFNRYHLLLEYTLEKKKVMPRRKFNDVADFEEVMKDEEEILIDGFEKPIERSSNYEIQKKNFSGKQHTHTDSGLVMSNRQRYIHYLSELYEGSEVDYGIMKKEFCPGEKWFRKKKVVVDLGFVGIDKDYEIKELMIGNKKPRKSKNNPNPKLTEKEKEWNKIVSKNRIYVEHAIGGMKIFRMLKNKCRLKSKELKNRIVGVAAGLWNYKLKFKNGGFQNAVTL